MEKVTISLAPNEWAILREQAERNMRPLRDHARYLIIRGMMLDDVPLPKQAAELAKAELALEADHAAA